MMAHGPTPIRPRVRSFIRRFNTNSQAVHVETDRGEYVIKAMNNRDGPPILIAEWIASMAAQWLGLSVPDFAIVELTNVVEIPLDDDGHNLACPGPCFGSKFVNAAGWDGDAETLAQVENVEMIPAILVADTWLRNLDRFCRDPAGVVRFNNPGNVLLRTDGAAKGKFRLSAIDFGYAFGGPSWTPRRLIEIGSVQDELIYGCFPVFRPFLQRTSLAAPLERLRNVSADNARAFITDIPAEWGMTSVDSDSITEFLCRRARFVADKLNNMIWEDDGLWGLSAHV